MIWFDIDNEDNASTQPLQLFSTEFQLVTKTRLLVGSKKKKLMFKSACLDETNDFCFQTIFLILRHQQFHNSLSNEYIFVHTGPHTFTENETIAKYEIMDGAPVRGESIPIRVFLAGYDLAPTMRDINKKFSVRYYLNLVLMDEEDRRYFKQQVRLFPSFRRILVLSCNIRSNVSCIRNHNSHFYDACENQMSPSEKNNSFYCIRG